MSFGAGFNKDFLLTDPCAKKIRELYERHWMPALEKSNIVRIPKIIHQIWMGSDLPVRCQALQATWRKHHPDWEYRLWNESDIEQLGLFNKKAFDAALTWGEKSDIARYEILYRFGGLYSDTDFECVRSFDPLHRCLDFYAGLENGECLVGNALIGSAPGHPILKSCIETLQSAKQGESGWQHVCNRTGPGHVTRCVKEHVMQEESDIGHCVLMPTGYFFPWYPYFGQVRTMQQALNSLRPETFAVHHWHSSWVK
jgi:mannosyltransferase OCH1-like enzyme